MSRYAGRPPRAFADFHDMGWRTGLFRAVLIAVLAAGATSAPVAILRILTSWRLMYVLPLAFLVALGGVSSTVRLGRPDWRDRRGLVFRLGEVIALLMVTRVSVWSFSIGWPTLTDIATWLRNPGSFFDDQFIAVFVLQLCVWGLAVSIAGDFLALGLQPDEVAAHESHEWGDTQSQWRVFWPVPRGEIVGRLARRWVWSGILLVTLAALSRITVATNAQGAIRFGVGRLGLPPDVLVGLLCYFVAGLLLLSDARLAVLRGRWYNERIEIATSVTQRWHLTSLLILLTVAGIALLLPLGSTGWLGQAVEWVLALIFRLLMGLFLLISALITFLLYLIRSPAESTEVIPAQPSRLPLVPTQAEVVRRLPDWVGGATLWVVIGVVAGYLLLSYLRASGRLQGLNAAWLIQLRLWWRARRARLDRTVKVGLNKLRVRWQARGRRSPMHPSVRLARMGDLLPRERVRYLYLRALALAAERGLERPPHETPLEFARDLEPHLSGAEDDVQALTDAFVDARYAPREIMPGEAESAQNAWQRLAAALRKPLKRDADDARR